MKTNERILAIAKRAGLKTFSEIALSPQELVFAKLLIEESFDAVIANGGFGDAKSIIEAAKFAAMEHFGVES
jgi:hypothetical protein